MEDEDRAEHCLAVAIGLLVYQSHDEEHRAMSEHERLAIRVIKTFVRMAFLTNRVTSPDVRLVSCYILVVQVSVVASKPLNRA